MNPTSVWKKTPVVTVKMVSFFMHHSYIMKTNLYIMCIMYTYTLYMDLGFCLMALLVYLKYLKCPELIVWAQSIQLFLIIINELQQQTW